MKEHLPPQHSPREKRGAGGAWWVTPVACLVLAATVAVTLLVLDRRGIEVPWGKAPAIGHVVRAYGTVKRTASYSSSRVGWLDTKLSDSWNRLDAGRSILEPLRSGDQVQTGDESAAEILFFGGSTLQLESASLARFAEEGDDVSVRLVLGQGYFEFPPASHDSSASMRFIFRKSDGTIAEVPDGKRLVLSLNSVERLEDALEVTEVDADSGNEEDADELEMHYLARGEEVGNLYALLVPPIEDDGHELDPDLPKRQKDRQLVALKPKAIFPAKDDDVDIEADENVKFKWDKTPGYKDDPVIGYEVIVRPAFGYNTDDRARKEQVFKEVGTEFPIEKVNGGGVFLWTVRAVTASGLRGPASTTRWLEIKFPKQMLPPQLIKPKVE